MVIAKTQLEYTEPGSNSRSAGEVVVETPYKCETGEWACPVTLLIDNNRWECRGDDSLQALNLALFFARQRLEDFVRKGYALYYPGDPDLFCLDSCFGYEQPIHNKAGSADG